MEKHTINKGFTLVEVIVSVGILAVVSVLFVTLFARMLEINITNKKINEASIRSASNITLDNFTCDLNPSVYLKFGDVEFSAPVATMCRSNSAPHYKLFRIVN